MISIELERDTKAEIDVIPNECPYCHKSIRPVLLGNNQLNGGLELIYQCPSFSCQRAFIASYISYNDYSFLFQKTNIGDPKETSFSEEIREISPSFVKIYNESFFAEQYNLTAICGVGYRKALEYLIKDYLITKRPDKKENIKKKFLGNCIKEDVSDSKIKTVSERAVWLGNDETHYTKLWEDKDVSDLKKLIAITLHWIEAEVLTEALEQKMPPRKK